MKLILSKGKRGKTIEVHTYEQASASCRNYIDSNNLGSREWTGGQILEGRKKVAYVSYNGKVWQGDETKWTPDTKLLYEPGPAQLHQVLYKYAADLSINPCVESPIAATHTEKEDKPLLLAPIPPRQEFPEGLSVDDYFARLLKKKSRTTRKQ